MTAFRFVTLVCDRCFAAFDPGTALTESDARADAADAGWTASADGSDTCRRCSPGTDPLPLADDLGIGEPILVSPR